MGRYRKGETSFAVRQERDRISASLRAKAEALLKVSDGGDVPPSLCIGPKMIISQAALHKWTDEENGIAAYARNSAHQPYHAEGLQLLLEALERANASLSSRRSSTDKKSKRQSDLSDAKVEIAALTKSLAEVYRAYMHLVDTMSESNRSDAAFQSALRAHAAHLGRARLKVVP